MSEEFNLRSRSYWHRLGWSVIGWAAHFVCPGQVIYIGRGNVYLSTEFIGQAGTQAWADAGTMA